MTRTTTFLLNVVLFLGLGLSIFLMQSNTSHVWQDNAAASHFDMFALKPVYIQYDSLGRVHSVFKADRANVRHHTTTFVKPVILTRSNRDRVFWTMTANSGRSSTDRDERIDLLGHVVLHQPSQAAQSDAATRITTQELSIYPKQSYAKTRQVITMTRAGSQLQGRGMQLNFKRGEVTLLSQTKLDYNRAPHIGG